MRNFSYERAASTGDAIHLLEGAVATKILGGGTNLVDLMRENIEQPDRLVDITGLPFDDIQENSDGGITIGAGTRNSAVARSEIIRKKFPVLAQAILSGASGQIRNMATVGGNIMQRTRCYYFYDGASHCSKRAPETGCDAIHGFNRMHAILGTSQDCIATHPSDLCVALSALGATVEVEGAGGRRSIAFPDFHRLPGNTPHIETDLLPGELITSVTIPKLDVGGNSLYRKVRDRSSYAFALVSVAAALEVENGVIRTVRLALGGVAHKPWRAWQAEALLQGSPATEESFRRAAEAELADAQGYLHNAFKIELAKRLIVSTMWELAGKGTAQ